MHLLFCQVGFLWLLTNLLCLLYGQVCIYYYIPNDKERGLDIIVYTEVKIN